ncbi:hypothetical protein [Moraxella lacunata]
MRSVQPVINNNASNKPTPTLEELFIIIDLLRLLHSNPRLWSDKS